MYNKYRKKAKKLTKKKEELGWGKEKRKILYIYIYMYMIDYY